MRHLVYYIAIQICINHCYVNQRCRILLTECNSLFSIEHKLLLLINRLIHNIASQQIAYKPMRNTYDNKNPYTGKSLTNANQQSKQRETYTNPNPKLMSFQKQAPSKHTEANDKMIKNILDTLKRLSLHADIKNLSLTSIKPNQKTLLTTIGVLLHSFDNAFDESCLTIQMLPELFKSLGYPFVINKTYFQPVGAPHTWPQCLGMMDWLADVVSFHIEIRGHLEQGDFSQDFTSLLIRAYLQNSLDTPKTYLDESINKKTQQAQASKYHTSTNILSIENIRASQKDLNIMQDQRKRLQSILNRETQQFIQMQQQNHQMQRKLKQVQKRVQQQKRLSVIHDQETQSLTREIQSQQLSVQEVEMTRFQIREFHERITQLKRFRQQQREKFDKIDNNIIEQYMDFNRMLEMVRHMHTNNRMEMQKRNVFLTVPIFEIQPFTMFLKARRQAWSDLRAQKLFGKKQIKQIRQRGQFLLRSVYTEITRLQQSRGKHVQQNRTINEQLFRKMLDAGDIQRQLDSLKQRLQTMRAYSSQVKSANDNMLSETRRANEVLKLANLQEQEAIREADQLAQETLCLSQLSQDVEGQWSEAVGRMEARMKRYQKQILELLENDYEYFEQLADQNVGDVGDGDIGNKDNSNVMESQSDVQNRSFNMFFGSPQADRAKRL